MRMKLSVQLSARQNPTMGWIDTRHCLCYLGNFYSRFATNCRHPDTNNALTAGFLVVCLAHLDLGFALGAIKNLLTKLGKEFQYDTLSWDEFVIQEDYNFDSKKLEFDGHVEYG